MLNPDRVKEVLWLARKIIQVDPKFKWNHIPIADILPYLEKDMAKAINGNGDDAEAFLSWFASAIFYMREDTDDLPQIELVWKLA